MFDPLITTAYRAGAGVARVVPRGVADAGGRVAARVALTAAPEKRRIVESNLERIHGRVLPEEERRRLVQATFESYARYYVDSFRLPSMTRPQVDAGLTVDGLGHIGAAMDAGTGPILALPHLGGWEWAALWLSLVPRYRVSAVAEPLEPPELFEWFVHLRAGLGISVIPLGPDALTQCLRAIADKHVLCLLADRDLAGDGVRVEFFGEATTMPPGPAVLALRTGTPLIPAAVYFADHGVHAVCLDPLDTERRSRFRDDVTRVTQDLAHAYERLIRAAPTQWHLLQPNWDSDRAGT